MRIDIITIHPQLLSGPLDHSILKRAQDKGLVEIHIHDLRQWSEDKHNRVDDYQFGGGAGMVMRIEPIFNCIAALKAERDYDEVIYMTPDGPTFAQPTANHLSTKQNIMILCGHYKGVDDRVRQHLITREISIGDYVLTGGELPAVVVCDAIIRLIPGVISDETSALFDSHQDGLLAPPVYTRPAEYNGWSVPEVLLSGNDRLIEEWRMNQAIERTKERRPGMLED
jgi:tRNA (guanine37-N1)-methyltransferase